MAISKNIETIIREQIALIFDDTPHDLSSLSVVNSAIRDRERAIRLAGFIPDQDIIDDNQYMLDKILAIRAEYTRIS